MEKERNRETEKKAKQSEYGGAKCLKMVKKQMVKKQSRRIHIWKTPGSEGVQGYWIKQLSPLHSRTGISLNKIVSHANKLPE